jgi:hypothetical protein
VLLGAIRCHAEWTATDLTSTHVTRRHYITVAPDVFDEDLACAPSAGIVPRTSEAEGSLQPPRRKGGSAPAKDYSHEEDVL